MLVTPVVQCRLAQDTISPETCREEQHPRMCQGCQSRTRRCTACNRPLQIVDTQTWRCDNCYRKAKAPLITYRGLGENVDSTTGELSLADDEAADEEALEERPLEGVAGPSYEKQKRRIHEVLSSFGASSGARWRLRENELSRGREKDQRTAIASIPKSLQAVIQDGLSGAPISRDVGRSALSILRLRLHGTDFDEIAHQLGFSSQSFDLPTPPKRPAMEEEIEAKDPVKVDPPKPVVASASKRIEPSSPAFHPTLTQHEGEAWATFEELLTKRPTQDVGSFRSFLKATPKEIRRVLLPATPRGKPTLFYAVKDVNEELGPPRT